MPNEDADQASVKTVCPTDPIATVLIHQDTSTSPPVHIDLCNWDQIDEFLNRDQDEDPNLWKLFILNGVHTKLAFELAMRMDIDPGFFDSHVYRTRYVPPYRGIQRINKKNKKEDADQKDKCKEDMGDDKEGFDFFQLDFPQVEELCIPETSPASKGSEIYLTESRWMLEEHVLSLAPDARKAYLLDGMLYRWDGGLLVGTFGYWRRMSFWSSKREKMSVMIIDPDMLGLLPPHVSPMALATLPFRNSVKRQNGGAVEALDSSYTRWRRRHRPHSFLEQFIQDTGRNSIYEIATHVALRQWNSFLSTAQVDRGSGQASSFSEVLAQRMENNIHDFNHRNTLSNNCNEWEALKELVSSKKASAILRITAALHDRLQCIESRVSSMPSPAQKDDKNLGIEERQALNRLSYMVGILLPFSIVAGLFSMEGEFRAGGRLFFTYWTLVVPGVVVAMVVVYGDTVRKRRVKVVSDTDSASERVVSYFWRRWYWWFSGYLRRRNGGSGTSSDAGSVSDIGRGEAVGSEIPPPQMFPTMPWGPPGRVFWGREDGKKGGESEELGWWRALRTLVGYKPDWADKD